MTAVQRSRPVLAGAGVALAVAVPVAVLAQVLDESGAVDDDSPWLFLLTALILAGMAAGGFAAAARRPDAPLTSGAVAALLAYVVVQAIGVVRRLALDEPVTWAAIPFFALLSAAAGVSGGMVAERRARTR